jgi:hypothetical protein
VYEWALSKLPIVDIRFEPIEDAEFPDSKTEDIDFDFHIKNTSDERQLAYQ